MARLTLHKAPPLRNARARLEYSSPVLLVWGRGTFSYELAIYDFDNQIWLHPQTGMKILDTDEDAFLGWMELPHDTKNVSISEAPPVAKASIGFGISLGVGFDIHPDFWNWHKLYADKIGRHVNEFDSLAQAKIWESSGVELAYGGDGTSVETSETIVVAKGSLFPTTQNRSTPIPGDALIVQPEWRARLKGFFTVMGFEFREPTWVLISTDN